MKHHDLTDGEAWPMVSRVTSESRDDSTKTSDLAGGRTFAKEDGADAGLVVLYAAEHNTLPSVFVLDRDVSLIGRGPANVLIMHPTVSRVHARIARTADGYVLRDAGSRNGVLVGGRPIVDTLLRANDEIRVGDTILKFVDRGAAAYEPYRIDGTVAAGAPRVTIPDAVGGAKMARLSAEIETVGATDMSVLITGETGTGKELVARGIHAASGRKGPFRALNCAALPPNLVESELFGFNRGAFSGATRDHAGIIRAAHGGTLLLDEIGDMPLEAQAKLLRTLETHEVIPVGGVRGETVDVRFVSATHRDLRSLADAGSFRGDLFARLNAYSIAMPPLRQRKEDIYMLVRRFLANAGASDREITFSFMVAACHYAWPYNVRELASAVKRAVTVSDGEPLGASHLPETINEYMVDYGAEPAQQKLPPRPAPARPTSEQLADLLRQHHGNVAAVARVLQKDRTQIHRWMRHLGIDPASFR